MEKVSVVIPVYNEKDTILELLNIVENSNFCGLEKEIIIVDDASCDGTKEILQNLQDKYKIYFHQKNKGKGAGIRTAFE